MYPAIKWWIFPVRYLHVYQRVPKWNILKSWPAWWFQHPWKIWKSVGIIKFPRYGKIKATFQTTNQWHFYAPKKHPVPPHICTYWDRGSSPVGRNNSTSPGSDTCELGSVTGGKKVGDKNWMRSNKNLSVCVCVQFPSDLHSNFDEFCVLPFELREIKVQEVIHWPQISLCFKLHHTQNWQKPPFGQSET